MSLVRNWNTLFITHMFECWCRVGRACPAVMASLANQNIIFIYLFILITSFSLHILAGLSISLSTLFKYCFSIFFYHFFPLLSLTLPHHAHAPSLICFPAQLPFPLSNVCQTQSISAASFFCWVWDVGLNFLFLKGMLYCRNISCVVEILRWFELESWFVASSFLYEAFS